MRVPGTGGAAEIGVRTVVMTYQGKRTVGDWGLLTRSVKLLNRC
jgi:hypothetical protein